MLLVLKITFYLQVYSYKWDSMLNKEVFKFSCYWRKKKLSSLSRQEHNG